MPNSFVNPSLLSILKIQNRGSNAESVLNQNRRLILQLIKDAGVISRKQLTERTGLKLATITIAVDSLMEKGLIEEVGLINGDMGRRIKGFSLSHTKYAAITIRLNPRYLEIAAYNFKNVNLYIKKSYINTFSDICHTCNVIVDEINEARSALKERALLGIALGVEGPFEIINGFYKYPDLQSPEGYFDIAKILNQRLGIPIIVNRQSNFAVYQLWKKVGNSNPLGIYVHLSISDTIECGIMINGEIINGSNGAAGLLGNIVLGNTADGSPILLEEKISSTAILDQVKARLKEYPLSILVLKKNNLDIMDVIRAYSLDDELAIQVFTEAGKYLGVLIANLESILNPDYIFIGDELPTTLRMKNIILGEAQKYLPATITPNLHLSILDYEHSRTTKDDPALLGANSYLVDAFIQSMEFGD